MLVEIERKIPGTGQRAVTQQIETEDAQTALARILSLGFARFAPGVPEWSMLRNGDRARVAGGAAYEYQAGTWIPIHVRPEAAAEQGRLF